MQRDIPTRQRFFSFEINNRTNRYSAMKFSTLFVFIYFIFISSLKAQEVPIGQWREMLSYRQAIAVAESGESIFCANQNSLFSAAKSDHSLTRYSKITGLSDIGFADIAYDSIHSQLVIGYTNSNIDLAAGTDVTNIPDLKNKTIVGDKNIYNIYIRDTLAYFSCGFGIVVVDLTKKEIKSSYYIGPNGSPLKINAVSSDNTYLYAATNLGIYRIALSDPFPENFADWYQFTPADGISQSAAETINFFNGKMYACSNNGLYYFDGLKWNFLFSQSNWNVISASASSQHLLVCELQGNDAANKILRVDVNNQIDSLTGFGYPSAAIEANDGATWVADLYGGLRRNENGNSEFLYPDGPYANDLYRLDVRKGEVFIATGSIGSGFNPEFNYDGFYWFDGSAWHFYNQNSNPPLGDSLIDIIAVAADPFSDKVYFGSMNTGGIVEFENGNINKIYKQGYVPEDNIDPGYYKVSALKFDANGNLWVAKPFSTTPVLLKTTDGKWYSFPAALSPVFPVHDFTIDPANQLWIVVNQTGLLLYNPGNDLTSSSDDESRQLSTSVGNGSLPTEAVNAVATDQDGLVWVGTGQGLVFFGCPTSFFTSPDCVDAQQIIVANDSTSGGYLLSTDYITSIAIDAGNRKWIGTSTDGVYLLSSDATTGIYHFTQDNSPLFSNNINDIKIDGSTGDVYIGTSVGLEVFHADALDGNDNSCSPYVYPNPVQSGYGGQIAIKGLVNNASVKITDISGTMIYQTTALGGQAVWNGQNYSGAKAKPGVYLVFAANSDGTVSCVTKLLIL
jgi:hypothetical protein